jgi:site-specific recombinase XerD
MKLQEVVNEHLFVGDCFQRCVMHIRKSKFDKTRAVPFMDANFLADLRQLVRGRKPTEPVVDVKRRMIMIQHIVQHAAEAAAIRNPQSGARHVSAHLFRHSIARHLKSAGSAAEFIRKFLDQSIQTDDGHLRDAQLGRDAADDREQDRGLFTCGRREEWSE